MNCLCFFPIIEIKFSTTIFSIITLFYKNSFSFVPEQINQTLLFLFGVVKLLILLTHLKMTGKKVQKIYLTRKEVSELLSISLPTLWRYTKNNKLQSYFIGSRVLYKLDEVQNSLTKLNY